MTAGVRAGNPARGLAKRLNVSSLVVLLGVIIVELIIFSVLIPEFMNATNLVNAARAASILGIVSVGVTFGLISGAIDLSVGSVLALAGVVAHTLVVAGVPAPAAIGGAIATGALCGVVNGVFTVLLRVPSLITTLGMLSIARGLAYGIADNAAPVSKDPLFTMFQTRFFDIPLTVWLAISVFVVGHYVLAYTRFGRYAYAVGDSGGAARDAGLPVDRLRIQYLMLSGGLAGLAGWVTASTIGIGYKGAGQGIELVVITTVLLGGVGFAGGSGKMIGTLIAVILMGILTNGMSLLGLISSYQIVVIGAILLIALGLQARRRGGFR